MFLFSQNFLSQILVSGSEHTRVVNMLLVPKMLEF